MGWNNNRIMQRVYEDLEAQGTIPICTCKPAASLKAWVRCLYCRTYAEWEDYYTVDQGGDFENGGQ